MDEKKQEELESTQQEEVDCEIQDEEITIKKSELDALQAEVAEAKDQRLRLAAEYDNFRKRTAREREGLFTDATAMAIGEFLGVYDNLERALSTPTEDAAYRKGIEMIYIGLCETMKKLRVEEINPEGEAFDPNLHNAVMHIDDEAFGENTVAEVFQKGFKIGDKVIRHAMVKVAN